jgi:hypothetical protein
MIAVFASETALPVSALIQNVFAVVEGFDGSQLVLKLRMGS